MLRNAIENLSYQDCIIFDIDGFFADCSHRLHHIEKTPSDWESFFAGVGEDTPILHNLMILIAMKRAYSCTTILMTGRPESSREKTEHWFRKLGSLVNYDALKMRDTGDYRPDHVVKREMLNQLRDLGYNILMAFDDRQHVVDMFREAGVPCFHITAPDPKKMELVKRYEQQGTEGEKAAPVATCSCGGCAEVQTEDTKGAEA